MKSTFYLIDGHSQIFRAYYAPFPPLTAPSGEPVKATLLFTQMVLGLIRDHEPDYVAVAMDVKDSSAGRLEIYPEYKKNRLEVPEDFPPQVSRIVEILETMRIPVLRASGFEADDVIASVVQRLTAEDVEIRIVSRDKDLHQLLSDRVKLWDPVKEELIDPAVLEERMGFRPAQAVEIQTLMGDSTDNVPGIPGIGPKTAVRLVRKYGTAQEVLAHADELTPKLRSNVLAHADRIPLARKLVTLDPSVKLDFDLEACEVKPIPVAELRPILEKLELRRLLEQLHTVSPAAQCERAEAGEVKVESRGSYQLVDTPEAFEDFLARISEASQFSVDTETTSLRCVDCDLVGLSFSWKEGEAYYLPVRSRKGRVLDRQLALGRLKPILENPSVGKCGQNIKFDLEVLRTEGIELAGVVFDSMVASYLLRSGERGHDIDTLALQFLDYQKIPTSDLLGKGSRQISMLDVDTERLAQYACEDADVAWRLRQVLAPRIEESPMKALFHDVELPLILVLADMEYEGVRLDCDHLQKLDGTLGRRIDELRAKIHDAAGRDFLVDSPKQLAEILFDEQKLRVVKTTKTSRSTDAEVLETLAIETASPLPRLVLRYRELAKLRGTYVAPLPKLVSPRTGRLHASFHQAVAATGRLSSSNPNIQNIPVRSPEGREIRKAFVPRDEDSVLISADYSQIELRILAHLSQDPALLEAFRRDEDIHTFVAAQIAGVYPEEVTREQRSQAKAVNFGIIYGQGAFGLARTLGIPRREASEFIRLYKERYPGIVSFMARCVEQADSTGAVTTLLGRRRTIEEISSRNRARRALGERLAINTVVQGTAADMIKVAMVRVQQRIRESQSPVRLLIQVHDELVLEAPRKLARQTAEMVEQEMIEALPLSVPLRVDTGWGDNWLAAGAHDQKKAPGS